MKGTGRQQGFKHGRISISSSLVPRPSNAHTSPAPQLQKRGNEKRTKRLGKITMHGSVLTVGMLQHVLMRERASVQPISIRVWLMTGSKDMVEHRNFENWSNKGPIVLKIWKRKFADFRNCGIPAGQLRARLFPRPFLLVGCVWERDYTNSANPWTRSRCLCLFAHQIL